MKILIVGNGGREHALLWKLRKDAPSAQFFVTRPNPGMAPMATAVDLAPDDVEGLASFAQGESMSLTVVGPEIPLAGGIADIFGRRGLPIFGPTATAARLESSKAFAKELMQRVGVPTASHRCFRRWEEAQAHLLEREAPVVVKASGLAAGKGAVVASTREEALAVAEEMLRGEAFGEAGSEIVVEDFMEGEELSVFGITDGRHVTLLIPSQDHKRIGEGDTGPNTGGMGAYAPVPAVDAHLMDTVRDRIFLPVLDAMETSARPFRGLLYAGLMLTAEGPRVVEFNCRFGDPETQVVLPLLADSILELLVAVARGGSIAGAEVRWNGKSALNTVLASEGYPGPYETGRTIDMSRSAWAGSDREEVDLLIFHAGTAVDQGRLITAGGRVFSSVGLGPDLGHARRRSLEGAESIHFPGRVFRRDIGWRALSGAVAAAATPEADPPAAPPVQGRASRDSGATSG